MQTECIQVATVRALTVRNVPDDVYLRLARTAKTNHRSLQQQVLAILESACVREADTALTTAAALRQRLSGRALGDTVADIREERER